MTRHGLPIALPLLVSLLGGMPSARADVPSPSTAEHAIDAPHFVEVENANDLPTFIAGESGTFDLRFHIAHPLDHEGRPLAWSTDSSQALVLLSAPEDSGIVFGDNQEQTGVFVIDLSSASNGVVNATVAYSVSSRVIARSYPILLDISTPLVAADGTRLLDRGELTLTVKVNTPLRTKLIVLAVLAFAIFMFVVEWVRVDVVAIMMMVSLPLLNLLSSKATFTGLSSNAVIAIIGVMIVSAGLNKVGLVSRVVKPEVYARYHAPARYGDEITVRTWLEGVQSRSVHLNYEVQDAATGQRLASGWTRHICMDGEGRACRLPPGMHSLLEQP